jgi:CheY-like chemotaxis protein
MTILADLLVIMVVEDDELIQNLVEEALSDGGFEPSIAASGEEAVTLLRGNRNHYRALVTDINLRGSMDGWEVAKQAREIDPSLPIVYMTGAAADQWASQWSSQQHSIDQAVRASAARDCCFPASQYRYTDNVSPRGREPRRPRRCKRGRLPMVCPGEFHILSHCPRRRSISWLDCLARAGQIELWH